MKRDLLQYNLWGTAETNNPSCPLPLYLPKQEEVLRICSKIVAGESCFDFVGVPVFRSWHWDDDNADWILDRWLPGRYSDFFGVRSKNIAVLLDRYNPNFLRLLVTAYLAAYLVNGELRSFEQIGCDGATGIPDAMYPCDTISKDPSAMGHDFIWVLHHMGKADLFGHVWQFDESNDFLGCVLRLVDLENWGSVAQWGLNHLPISLEKWNGV